ncbi:hypothetical protein [Actinoplanes sp. NPDC049681]|uniref:hypothetical protein n=1 Tax=Actinoplanes sp. NPDC049681 TaxID=3363905 RepID=UPI00378D5084
MTDLPDVPTTSPATRPLAATISLLGILVTGLCLAAAERLDRSAPARVLAVAAVVTALIAVLVALAAQLPGMTSVRTIRLAATLSGVAVLLAGTGSLFVILARESTSASTEPGLIVQRTSTGEMDSVTAELTFPGLKPGSVLTATLSGISTDSRYDLARTVVRVGEKDPAVVSMTASINNGADVEVEATAPGHHCTARLSSGNDAPLSCTSR